MVGITKSDPLAGESKPFAEVGDWKGLLPQDPKGTDGFRQHPQTARLLESSAFLEQVQFITERVLRLRKTGRK